VRPKPERLENLELGWRGKLAKHFLDVNYYWMNYKYQLVLTGEIDNTGFPIRANVGKSYRTGVEASANFNFIPTLIWNVNATWAENKNKDFVIVDENNVSTFNNTSIVLSPSLIAGSQLSWDVFNGFNATWLSKYVSRQYLDNSQDEALSLDDYFINDLRFSYSFSFKAVKDVTASLLLNNVLDTRYASNGYVYFGTAYYYPQAGRNLLMMLSLRF
jgi:iron complex outermembrane receptor protein